MRHSFSAPLIMLGMYTQRTCMLATAVRRQRAGSSALAKVLPHAKLRVGQIEQMPSTKFKGMRSCWLQCA
jgi:hypothetical protein